MADKDVREIVKIFNQLQGQNADRQKKNKKTLSKQISMFKTHSGNKTPEFRNGSIFDLSTNRSKNDLTLTSKSKLFSSNQRPLFWNERSFSMTNLSSTKPMSSNPISFTKYSFQSPPDYKEDSKLLQEAKSPNKIKSEDSNIYESLPTSGLFNESSIKSEAFSDRSSKISINIFDSFLETHPAGLSNSKDSFELNKNTINKHKTQINSCANSSLKESEIEKDDITKTSTNSEAPTPKWEESKSDPHNLDFCLNEKFFQENERTMNDVCNEASILKKNECNDISQFFIDGTKQTTKSPELTLEKQESKPTNQIPIAKTTNKFSFNHLNFQLSNEITTSSESGSDISDPLPSSHTGIFYIEADSPTTIDKTDSNRIAPINTSSFSEIKTVQSEEEKNKLFRMIAKDISMKSYSTKEIIRFNMANGTFSSQIIDISQTAFSVCILLKNHFNIDPKSCWQIVECLQADSLDRPMEDHEIILDVFYSWKHENSQNKFMFRENPNMYKIFLSPEIFDSEMRCDFEIEDCIWVKEINSHWKKAFCFILDATVYFKFKQNSKNHKDLYSLVNLKNVDFYTCADLNKMRKSFRCPTSDLIVFKSNKLEHRAQEHPCLAFQNRNLKDKWIESLKVAKFSFDKLKQNYLNYEKNFEKSTRIQSFYPANSVSSFNHFNPSSV